MIYGSTAITLIFLTFDRLFRKKILREIVLDLSGGIGGWWPKSLFWEKPGLHVNCWLTLVKLHYYQLDKTRLKIYVSYLETIKSGHETAKVSSFMATFILVENSGHRTATVSSSMAAFSKGPKAAIELPRSAVWAHFPPGCPKPAIELLRSAVFHRCAQNRPWNCLGQQFANGTMK